MHKVLSLTDSRRELISYGDLRYQSWVVFLKGADKKLQIDGKVYRHKLEELQRHVLSNAIESTNDLIWEEETTY